MLSFAAIFLVLLIVVFGVIAWLMTARKGSIAAGLVAFLVALFISVALFTARTKVVMRDPEVVQIEPVQRSEFNETIPSKTQVRVREYQVSSVEHQPWELLDYDQFRAEIFPDIDGAAQQLGREIMTDLLGWDAQEMAEEHLVIEVVDGDPSLAATAETVGNVIRKQLQNVDIHTAPITAEYDEKPTDDDGKDVTNVVSVQLNVEDSRPAAWDSSVQVRTGDLVATYQTENGPLTVTVTFAEKPWLAEMAEFLSRHSGDRFSIGISPSTCETQPIANAAALSRSPRVLAGYVNGRQIWIDSSQAVIDRFSQKLSRPYGDVWREAVLVDLQSEELEAAKRQAILAATANFAAVRQEKHAQTSWVLGLFAAFAGVGCLGLLLNFVTEGYYRARIVILIVSAFLLLVFVTEA